MTRVLLACRGEGHWGSREEDGAKIDLRLSLKNPLHPNERMSLLCQVKSGSAYGEIISNDKGFKLTANAKKAAKRDSHAICMIWVDRDVSRAFWAYLHPDTKVGAQVYGSNHEINPTMTYDLARCIAARAPRGAVGGNGVTLPESTGDVSARRQSALREYRSLISVNSPVLGDVELTRTGWRHMFRKGRAAVNKNASLNLIPRLRPILSSHPSTTAMTAVKFLPCGGYTRRVCEYLLKYNRVRIRRNGEASARKVTVHIRVIEEICFPKDWAQIAMLSQQISRRVVLKSAYYKEE